MRGISIRIFHSAKHLAAPRDTTTFFFLLFWILWFLNSRDPLNCNPKDWRACHLVGLAVEVPGGSIATGKDSGLWCTARREWNEERSREWLERFGGFKCEKPWDHGAWNIDDIDGQLYSMFVRYSWAFGTRVLKTRVPERAFWVNPFFSNDIKLTYFLGLDTETFFLPNKKGFWELLWAQNGVWSHQKVDLPNSGSFFGWSKKGSGLTRLVGQVSFPSRILFFPERKRFWPLTFFS